MVYWCAAGVSWSPETGRASDRVAFCVGVNNGDVDVSQNMRILVDS